MIKRALEKQMLERYFMDQIFRAMNEEKAKVEDRINEIETLFNATKTVIFKFNDLAERRNG